MASPALTGDEKVAYWAWIKACVEADPDPKFKHLSEGSVGVWLGDNLQKLHDYYRTVKGL